MRKIATALVACLTLTACGSTSTPPPPASQLGNTMDGAVAKTILALPLVDSTGHARRLSDFAGKIIVISPILTLCQETCPLDTAAFTQMARSVAASPFADKVVFLTITVDPGRDTPPQLAAYRQLYGKVSPHWILLTGKPTTIAALWKYFGIWVQRVSEDRVVDNWRTGQRLTYDVNHTDAIIYIDAQAHERFILQGPPDVRGSTIPASLVTFLDAQGHANIAHPPAGTWTATQGVSVLNWLLGHVIAPR